MDDKKYKTIESNSVRELDILVNQKIEEGYIVVGELNVAPCSYIRTETGYSVDKFKFFRTVVKKAE